MDTFSILELVGLYLILLLDLIVAIKHWRKTNE